MYPSTEQAEVQSKTSTEEGGSFVAQGTDAKSEAWEALKGLNTRLHGTLWVKIHTKSCHVTLKSTYIFPPLLYFLIYYLIFYPKRGEGRERGREGGKKRGKEEKINKENTLSIGVRRIFGAALGQ